jgi:hypothetical protein
MTNGLLCEVGLCWVSWDFAVCALPFLSKSLRNRRFAPYF